MNTTSHSSVTWNHFVENILRYTAPDISLDTSRIDYPADFSSLMKSKIAQAFSAMRELESGAIANPDEKRMVGHYWLREPKLAPTDALRVQIKSDITAATTFAAQIHKGEIRAANNQKFTDLLLIGIGGSALGPQLVSDALGDLGDPLTLHTFDNTDPDGMERTLRRMGGNLATTLTLVISKSGNTAETRNGMLLAKAAYESQGLKFGPHAVAVTGVASKLDTYAQEHHFLKRFPMQDWVGGRTSIMHTVGLVPMSLQGLDIAEFLRGAQEMDSLTRKESADDNMAMKLALAWYATGDGRGLKDMVVLPYKDRLLLLSKYLQQLVMESLGKERDLNGNLVHQGLAVYGNKGSTDQHAYVQQLRDGVHNFFATFIEVRQSSTQTPVEVEPGVTSGDYLQGFLRGTREALAQNGRESLTISIPCVNAYYLGALIALFERTVGFYATLVNINAYHQPGVEAGKIAAGDFLLLLAKVHLELLQHPGEIFTAETMASAVGAEVESVYHGLNHLAGNQANISVVRGATPAQDQFQG